MNRFCDIVLVCTALPLVLPLLFLCALAVLVFEGRPIFFYQERAGLQGRSFRMIKFRTMRCGAGSDAARLTRFGQFLRMTSLDELPELIHVLTGTMALVGPRPLPTAYLTRYSHGQARRHEVRPGLTGWAQVHGRNRLSWDEKFAYDVWYVDHRSFLLDWKIIFMTFIAVFSMRDVSAENTVTMEEFKGGGK